LRANDSWPALQGQGSALAVRRLAKAANSGRHQWKGSTPLSGSLACDQDGRTTNRRSARTHWSATPALRTFRRGVQWRHAGCQRPQTIAGVALTALYEGFLRRTVHREKFSLSPQPRSTASRSPPQKRLDFGFVGANPLEGGRSAKPQWSAGRRPTDASRVSSAYLRIVVPHLCRAA
jgi:hypothetical protein